MTSSRPSTSSTTANSVRKVCVRIACETYTDFVLRDLDVYVREAIGEHPGYSDQVGCANFGKSQEVVLAGNNGNTGYGSFPVYEDGCGHSCKPFTALKKGQRDIILMVLHRQGRARA